MNNSAIFTEDRPLCTQITGSSPINHSWHQKIRDTELPDGEDHIPLCSLILAQYRSVIDRRTERRICRSIHSACKAGFAMRCKNEKIFCWHRTVRPTKLIITITTTAASHSSIQSCGVTCVGNFDMHTE